MNILNKKAVLFDLDGTLIDSIKDITTSANLALKDYNYPIQNEDIVRLHTGNGFRKLIKELLPIDSNDELIDESQIDGEVPAESPEVSEEVPEMENMVEDDNPYNLKQGFGRDEYAKTIENHDYYKQLVKLLNFLLLRCIGHPLFL